MANVLVILLAVLGWLTPIRSCEPILTPFLVSIGPVVEVVEKTSSLWQPSQPNAPPKNAFAILESMNPGALPEGSWVLISHGRPLFFVEVHGGRGSVRIIEYAYAGGDPVNRWDPSGLDWYSITDGNKSKNVWFENESDQLRKSRENSGYKYIGKELPINLRILCKQVGYKFPDKPITKQDEILKFVNDGKISLEDGSLQMWISIKSQGNQISFSPKIHRPINLPGFWEKWDNAFSKAAQKNVKNPDHWKQMNKDYSLRPHYVQNLLHDIAFAERPNAYSELFQTNTEAGSLAPVVARSSGKLKLISDNRDPASVLPKQGDLGPFLDIGWRSLRGNGSKWLWSSNYYYDDLPGNKKVGPFSVENGLAQEGAILPPLNGIIDDNSSNSSLDLYMFSSYGTYSFGTSLGVVKMSISTDAINGRTVTVDDVNLESILPLPILRRLVYRGNEVIMKGFTGKYYGTFDDNVLDTDEQKLFPDILE